MARLIMLTTRAERAFAEAARSSGRNYAVDLADHAFVDLGSLTIRQAREMRLLDSVPEGFDLYWMDHFDPSARLGSSNVTLYFVARSEWDVLAVAGIAETLSS